MLYKHGYISYQIQKRLFKIRGYKKMKKYTVSLYRYFYVSEEVEIEAESSDEAYLKAQNDFNSLVTSLPSVVYDYLEFSESDIEVIDLED